MRGAAGGEGASSRVSEMILGSRQELDHEENLSLGRELALYPINQGIMVGGCGWCRVCI